MDAREADTAAMRKREVSRRRFLKASAGGAAAGTLASLVWLDDAVSYIYGEPMVDKDRIGVWGTSFGGGHVIYRAAHDPRIACVVAQVGSMPDDWTKRYPAGLKPVYKQKSDRARGVTEPVPQGESPSGLNGSPHPERIALFNPGQYADRVRVPTLLIDAEKEHYFKIGENSGRVHKIIEKNGVPTEYHVLKGIGHYDVYSGQPLDAMAQDWRTGFPPAGFLQRVSNSH